MLISCIANVMTDRGVLLIVPAHAEQEALLNVHDGGDKRFEMEDDFGAGPCPQFVESGFLDNGGFDLGVDLINEVVCEMLEDEAGWDGVDEKLVKFGADGEEVVWGGIGEDEVAGADRLTLARIGDDDVAEALFEVLEVAG